MAWEDRSYYRDEPPRLKWSVPMPTPLTVAIMGACVVMFIMVNIMGAGAPLRYGDLTFRQGLAFKQPWRWVTYAYLHASGSHLFWNMLVLYFFLPPLENVWGWRRTLGFYTLGTIAAGVTFGLMNLFYPFVGLIGASGGILAALGACAYLFPEMMIFLVIPIRVCAALIAVLYLLTVAGDKNPADAAHLGGLAFGFFAPYYGRKLFGGTLLGGFSQKIQTKRRRAEVDLERKEQETIDRILAKVHADGMNSLSWSEKRALRKATEKQRQREVARARRVR
jgi:membrane associated rhomboid family serine protease